MSAARDGVKPVNDSHGTQEELGDVFSMYSSFAAQIKSVLAYGSLSNTWFVLVPTPVCMSLQAVKDGPGHEPPWPP